MIIIFLVSPTGNKGLEVSTMFCVRAICRNLQAKESALKCYSNGKSDEHWLLRPKSGVLWSNRVTVITLIYRSNSPVSTLIPYSTASESRMAGGVPPIPCSTSLVGSHLFQVPLLWRPFIRITGHLSPMNPSSSRQSPAFQPSSLARTVRLE